MTSSWLWKFSSTTI